jgi:hypothetical protein
VGQNGYGWLDSRIRRNAYASCVGSHAATK